MNRRDFLRATGIAAAGATVGPTLFGGLAPTSSALAGTAEAATGLSASPRVALPLPRFVSPTELTLNAAETAVPVANHSAAAWTFNGSVPGPPIQVQRGDRARIELHNALREPTIVHWHGLHVPEADDGHPRLAVPPNQSYAYDFIVDQRAAMYWYHPHAHARTGAQVYQGLAGIFVVRDAEEEALRLPDGDREIFLLLQDRRAAADPATAFAYRPAGPDMMMGLLGDTPFGNGVPTPTLDTEASTYRVRVLNGSNARIYRLALGTGAPFVVIGNDGGLLPSPTRVESLDIAPGERVDLLIDLSSQTIGSRVMLQSLAFELPGGMGGMGRGMGRGMGDGMAAWAVAWRKAPRWICSSSSSFAAAAARMRRQFASPRRAHSPVEPSRGSGRSSSRAA